MLPFFDDKKARQEKNKGINNFFSFKKIMNSIHGSQFQKDYDEMTKIFNHYAKGEDISYLLEIVEKGYSINEWQKKQIYMQIFHERGDINGFEKTLDKGIHIPDEFLIFNLLVNTSSVFILKLHFGESIESYGDYYKNMIEKNPKMVKLYLNKLNDPKFKRKIFLAWKTILENVIKDDVRYLIYSEIDDYKAFYLNPHTYYESRIREPVYILKNVLFEMAEPKEYFECLNLLKKFPEYSKFGGKENKAYYKQYSKKYDAQSLATNIEQDNFYNFKERSQKGKSITAELTNDINNTIINPLLYKHIPNEAQNLILSIKTIYENLIKDNSQLEPDKQILINTIYIKRLPELLERFSNVSKENIDIKRNSGELLISSLSDIKEIFESILLNLNTKKLEDLSSTVNYLKQLKI